MVTNLEVIVDALSTALEKLTPDTRPNVPFRRYKGAGPVQYATMPVRERAFQFTEGSGKTPRTLSSPTIRWKRGELRCTIGYNFTEPQQGDVSGVGFQRISMSDERLVHHALYMSNALASVPNVLRVAWLLPDPPDNTSRIYRLDIEWGETFPVS